MTSTPETTLEAIHSYVYGTWYTTPAHNDEKAAFLYNPTTDEAIATASSTGVDFAKVADYARTVGGPALRALSFAERGAILDDLRKALYAKRDALIDDSIKNGGTTRSDAKFDIDGAIGTLAHYAQLGKKLGEQLGDKPFWADAPAEQLLRGPRFVGYHAQLPRRGLALHINAFNFPAWGLAEKLAAAFLAGMPTVSKPATSTALVAYRVAQILVDTGKMPVGSFQFIAGSASSMLDHLGPQDVLAFTGSADTGLKLRTHPRVAKASVRVNVEADSLNSAILGLSADVNDDAGQMFIRDVAKEMTQKTGQKCTAVRRIFVPADKMDDVQAILSERLADLIVGDPARDDVRMGPLATKDQLRDARAGVAILEKSGAKIVFGSVENTKLVGDDAQSLAKGYFMGPILLRADDAHGAAAVHNHEVFAPVATLLPYQSMDELIELVAKGEGSLVSSFYSDDRSDIQTAINGLAPYLGRLLVGSSKVADQAISPGTVLPASIHGGPGRAGGGEELGGLRGLSLYMQRTAIQGDKTILDKLL